MRKMGLSRIFVFLLQAMICFSKGTSGDGSQCGERTSVVNICKNSKETMKDRIFIDTAYVPKRQRNTCSCIISPNSSKSQVSLTYRKFPSESENVHFILPDIVLNKTHALANTTLNGSTELIFETESDFNIKDVCLTLFTVDGTQFNISCENQGRYTEKSKHMTTLQSTLFTTTTDEPKTSSDSRLDSSSGADANTNDMCLNSTSCNESTNGITYSTETGEISTTLLPNPALDSDENSGSDDKSTADIGPKLSIERSTAIVPRVDNDGNLNNGEKSDVSSIIGVTIGSAVGAAVFLIVLILIAIVICKMRTVKETKNNKSERTSNIDEVVAARNDVAESDYYMTENPLYNMTEPITITSETPLYSQVNKNTKFIQNMEENDNINTDRVYDFIPDTPNELCQPLVAEAAHENNIIDTQKFECEYTKVGNDEGDIIST